MKSNLINRRSFMTQSIAFAGACRWAFADATKMAPMAQVSKEIFIAHRNGAGVFPGFLTYIDGKKTRLLHRFGWVDASDTYDNFHESISEDNGTTWTAPVLKLKSKQVPEGRMRYCENSAFYDAERNKLTTIVSKFLYPNNKFSQDQPRELEINTFDPDSKDLPKPKSYTFGLPGGMACSFCFPIKSSTGRIIVPGFTAQVGKDGKFLHHPKSKSAIYEVRMVLGDYQADGRLQWRVGEAVDMQDIQTTRGFSESAPLEYKPGRIALLMRGSNAGVEEWPGYKWLAFSENDGQSWSKPTPLCCDDGKPIESSATGCALFRSIKNGKIYYIGNLCADGERAKGNWPRSPLYIAEVQEEPFALRRKTIRIIDERGEGEGPQTQISNFRYYQDRLSGAIVLFVSRFGEANSKEWKKANYYRFRIGLE